MIINKESINKVKKVVNKSLQDLVNKETIIPNFTMEQRGEMFIIKVWPNG